MSARPRFPKTCAVLREMGINPDTVAEDGIDLFGYDKLVLDGAGKRTVSNGRLVTQRKSWPTGIDGFRIVATYSLERWGIK